MADDTAKIVKSYSSPLERRFVAFARRFEPFVPPFVKPNHITVASFLCAVAGGASFYLSRFGRAWLIVAVAAVLFHFVLDNLDGEVARARGQASERGRFLDIYTDCFAIAAIFIGIGHSPYATMDAFLVPLVLWFLHLVLMYNWMQLKGEWIFPLLSNFELMLLIFVCSAVSFFYGPVTVSLGSAPFSLFDIVALGGGALSFGELLLSAFRLYRSLD